MKLLLDTHAMLWFYMDNVRLSTHASSLIEDDANEKYVSPASYWELAIKISLGQYSLSESYDDFIQHAIHDNGFENLPIEPHHASALVTLPFHHKDPFDRLLIAQAIVEGLSIISVDPQFDQYPITRLW